MGISLHVSVLVMHPMRCHPEKRSAFQGQSAAEGHKIFQPLVSLVAAVCEQAMVARADSETAGNVQQNNRHRQTRPAEHEEGGYGSDVKSHHEKGGHPTDGFLERPVIPDAHSSCVSPESKIYVLISKLSGTGELVCNSCVIAGRRLLSLTS